jgi:hypothetical protein
LVILAKSDGVEEVHDKVNIILGHGVRKVLNVLFVLLDKSTKLGGLLVPDVHVFGNCEGTLDISNEESV